MDKPLEEYRPILAQINIAESKRLAKTLDYLIKRREQNKPFDKKLSDFENKLSAALDQVFAKQKLLPLISYPENLPISEKRDDIAKIIADNQVVVLAGETGSGKTTQIPKICLELGRGIRGTIGHTQPRRIAARTVASRIAEELNSSLGSVVGYQVRFTDHTNENTFVKLMTDGILLAEIQNDPLLLKYDTLIIDEAHERSLNIDFLLGYLKGVLPKRPDLKLIITSATIDLERFSKHFSNAPIIEVSGRTYPVETIYRPWDNEYEDLSESIIATVDEITKTQARGDILIFLSGERDIREVSHAIKKANFPHLNVLPLYARLSLEDQNKVFAPHKGTRVVLATNVAETSITVPGIKYVIDPGYARISRYSIRTKVQRLPIEAISQASANQRKGRCGRVSYGVCYRLYSEEDFNSRPEFTDAEILRTNLAAVILQMLQMRVGDIRSFPFVDAPDKKYINDGYKLLEELKAVDPKGVVTPLGKQLGALPLDPRMAAIVFEAKKLGVLHEALIVVTALSIQDPRERPADKKQASDEKHRRFWDDDSDFVAYLKLWDYFEEQRQELSQNQLRKLCKKEFINYLRMREWRDLHYQLKLSLKRLDIKVANKKASYEDLHKSLICGLLTQLGNKDSEKDSREYFGTRQKKFSIFPGSSQAKKKHKWIMAAEFIETSQLFAHCVAKIDPEWVLPYAQHLSKQHYFEPHYDVKMGQVRAYCRTSLLGLVLQEKKRVVYSKVDIKLSNEIFVREALVEGKYRGKGEFFKHNQSLIEDVHSLEAKSRRRDILVEEEAIVDFYSQRVPNDISDLRSFEKWRKQAELHEAKLLFLTKSDLMLHAADELTVEQFPSQITLGDMTFPVTYCFEPGKINDGVNISVPVEVLHEIPEVLLDWVVPGVLRDKCMALVKALPKSIRKNFVPVPQYVDKVLPRLERKNVALAAALGDALSHISQTKVDASDWDGINVDDFYKINVQVVDENGKVVDQSRDLQLLRRKYKARVNKTLRQVGSDLEKTELICWDFGKLEESVSFKKGSVSIKAYPVLRPSSPSIASSVDLKLIDNPQQAQYESRYGILRLAYLANPQINKYLRQRLMKGKELGLTQVSLGKKEKVIDTLILAGINDALFTDGNYPREQRDFEQAVENGRGEVVEHTEYYESLLIALLDQIVQINKSIRKHKNPLAIALAVNDIKMQLSNLVYVDFLIDVPLERLKNYPRYLNAIEIRLEKIGQNGAKDRVWAESLAKLWEKHESRLAKEHEWSYHFNSEWQKYRWMLEELRVSYFAQSLKTELPVSEKRLIKQWEISHDSTTKKA